MRYTTLFAAGVLTLIAFGASAQTAGKEPTVDQQQTADKRKRASTEPINSPFTYEALGATPSLQTKKRAKPAGDEKVAAEPVKGSQKTAPARANESATVETSSGSQGGTKQ